MADRLEEAGDDAKVEIVVPEGGGRACLSVDKLGAVGEPESLTGKGRRTSLVCSAWS